MAYVYRHIRLDKNVPFYIGIGADDNGKYYRAYLSHGRSAYWKRVVAKTKYEVEILLDDISWDEACTKEKEFISLYGRRNKDKGTLVNLTDGGEGVVGVIVSEETKRKYSKIINAFDKKGDFIATFKSFKEASCIFHVHDGIVCDIINGKRKATKNGIRFRLYSEDLSNIGEHVKLDQKGEKGHFFGKVGGNKDKFGKDHPASKPVNQLDLNTNQVVNTFNSIREAGKYFGTVNTSGIVACCKGTLKTSCGYKWEYRK